MTEQEIVELIKDRKSHLDFNLGMREDYPSTEISWEFECILRKIIQINEEQNELLELPQYAEAKAKCEEMDGVITKLISSIEMPKGYKLSATISIVGDLNEVK